MTGTHALLIGGRSGVGKSTVALAIHELLATRSVRHAVIEGDNLDLAFPTPWQEHPEAKLAESNLASIWTNYRALGYRRLIYTNTASVVRSEDLIAALGPDATVTSVLLRGSDEAIAARLSRRESGESLAAHLDRSKAAAAWLDSSAPASVIRVETDGRTPHDVAAEVVALLNWDALAGS